jgi:hypothetical protein
VNSNSYFPKPVPFGPKSAAMRRESSSRRAPAKPPEPVYYSSMLAGVAIGLLVFSGLALTLFLASLVWTSPHRTWYLCALFVAYVICTFATTLELTRRLRAWRPLGELQTRLRQDGRNLSNLLKSAQRNRMPSASDY